MDRGMISGGRVHPVIVPRSDQSPPGPYKIRTSTQHLLVQELKRGQLQDPGRDVCPEANGTERGQPTAVP